jgi:hypothetical protein
MNSTAYLLLSVLFSSIGVGYFIYGKRQMKMSALAGGAALCVYPYMVSNTYLLVAVGSALVAAPFLFDF